MISLTDLCDCDELGKKNHNVVLIFLRGDCVELGNGIIMLFWFLSKEYLVMIFKSS